MSHDGGRIDDNDCARVTDEDPSESVRVDSVRGKNTETQTFVTVNAPSHFVILRNKIKHFFFFFTSHGYCFEFRSYNVVENV